jgi:DNA-binding transcriptional LysR family regulator
LQTFYRNEVELIHAQGEHCRLSIRPRMSTDSLFALRTAALMGLGVCVASAWAVQDDLAQGTLVHVTPQWHAAPLPMHLLYPYSSYYPAKLRRFVEVLRASLPAALQDIQSP